MPALGAAMARIIQLISATEPSQNSPRQRAFGEAPFSAVDLRMYAASESLPSAHLSANADPEIHLENPNV
jgi:hypothetical protein